MANKGWGIYGRAALLGIVAGMRSMTPFAVLSWMRWRSKDKKDSSRGEQILTSVVVRSITTLAAGGELVADKLPQAGSRLAPPSLIVRVLVGGLAGAVLCWEAKRAILLGAILGAAGGAAGSYGGYYARLQAGKATHLPDPVLAVVEDSLAVGFGLFATRD